jgi:hypothetical protein
MNSKLWIRKALSLCLSVAILATYSMVALAGPRKVAGELTVSGKDINGEAPFVLVNGEAARSGRSIFSTSTITTPEGTGAVVNLGKLGRLDLAPSTALTLTFDETGVSAGLTSGILSVFGTTDKVSVKTLDGKTVQLSAGQSLAASGKLQDDDDDDDDGGAAWLVWAGVFGGAAVAILWTALSDGDIDIQGGGTVISPTR